MADFTKKSYNFRLTALSSSQQKDKWVTTLSMRDFDDLETISISISTKYEIMDAGNLSVIAKFPLPVA